MHLRLHEIVEAGDPVISFNTYLMDEVWSSDKQSELLLVAASGKNRGPKPGGRIGIEAAARIAPLVKMLTDERVRRRSGQRIVSHALPHRYPDCWRRPHRT